jgi:pyruvate/2-oxoglutarate dehydrogenase complex dihydrolipoamide dehydrogenase (E3) component
MPTAYDALIIGTGQSGPSLAVRLANAGKRVAIVERKRFGGTCVNNGCIPTKTLIASARAAWVARHAGELGVRVGGDISVDMKAVKARKDRQVSDNAGSVERWLRGTKGLTVLEGTARFEASHRVRVGEQTIEAEQIFVNVGGRAIVPEVEGLADVPYWTNSTIMDVDFLPEHLVIVGGSYIGLEFAQMYRRFGSRVTLLESGPRLISRDDDDVAQAVREILEAEGVEIRTGTGRMKRAARDAGGIRVQMGDGSTVEGSHLLVAVGRRPNTDDLGLQEAGIATDKRGFIVVDDELRTSAAGVWALGDCNGRGAFTHTSYNDFEIVAANLLDGDRRRVSDRIVTYGLFVDPPLGRCGMTEREVRATGKKALVARMPMTRVGRANERGETQGFMKVLVDAESRQILGAAILGIGGDEVVHVLLDVMYARAPYTLVQRAMHIHPTVAEYLPTLLGDLRPLE